MIGSLSWRATDLGFCSDSIMLCYHKKICTHDVPQIFLEGLEIHWFWTLSSKSTLFISKVKINRDWNMCVCKITNTFFSSPVQAESEDFKWQQYEAFLVKYRRWFCFGIYFARISWRKAVKYLRNWSCKLIIRVQKLCYLSFSTLFLVFLYPVMRK